MAETTKSAIRLLVIASVLGAASPLCFGLAAVLVPVPVASMLAVFLGIASLLAAVIPLPQLCGGGLAVLVALRRGTPAALRVVAVVLVIAGVVGNLLWREHLRDQLSGFSFVTN